MDISASLPTSLPLPVNIAAQLDSSGNPGVDFAKMMESLGSSTTNLHSGEGSTQPVDPIEKIGQDFESIFISMMLKEMRKSISSEEGSGLFGGDKSDTYGGMFDMFMSQHLASSSSLGIADAVTQSLSGRINKSQP